MRNQQGGWGAGGKRGEGVVRGRENGVVRTAPRALNGGEASLVSPPKETQERKSEEREVKERKEKERKKEEERKMEKRKKEKRQQKGIWHGD